MSTTAIERVSYRFMPRGVWFDPTQPLDGDEWRSVGIKLGQIVDGATWGLGDWILAGIEIMGTTDAYTFGITVSGRSYEVLAQYAGVSRAFPIETRVHRVSWSHYREAMRLPAFEREAALAHASTERLSRQRFSQWIENKLAIENGREPRPVYKQATTLDGRKAKDADGKGKTLDLRCPSCGHRWHGRIKRSAVKRALKDGGDDA